MSKCECEPCGRSEALSNLGLCFDCFHASSLDSLGLVCILHVRYYTPKRARVAGA